MMEGRNKQRSDVRDAEYGWDGHRCIIWVLILSSCKFFIGYYLPLFGTSLTFTVELFIWFYFRCILVFLVINHLHLLLIYLF